MTEVSLSRCRVVLVRPHYHGNLGSAARVMKNFGLRELVLVEPVADPNHSEALMMAMRGTDILANCRVVPTIADAIHDCGFVLATSGEIGGLRRQGFWGTPEEKLPTLVDALPTALTAILFGPEPSGLTVEEISATHGSIYIPADLEFPSLNLAQSVAVVLYELRKQFLLRKPIVYGNTEPPADYNQQEHLFRHLKEALLAIRFLWDFRSDGIFHVIRQVIGRSRPTLKEVSVYHGLAKQLLFVAKFWGVTHPRDGRPPKLLPLPPPPAGDENS